MNKEDQAKTEDTWTQWVAKQAAGTALLSVAAAAVGASIAAIRKKDVKGITNSAAGYAAIGALASLGMGKDLYEDTIGRFQKKNSSFVDKIEAERQQNNLNQR